jgi:hypothetical protein
METTISDGEFQGFTIVIQWTTERKGPTPLGDMDDGEERVSFDRVLQSLKRTAKGNFNSYREERSDTEKDIMEEVLRKHLSSN